MNEEKDPKWFVWERGTSKTQAAIYRGMPMSGSGKTDAERFLFKKQLELDEQGLTLDELIERYPAP